MDPTLEVGDVDVLLVQLDVVDEDPPPLDDHVVAGQTDDALDVVQARIERILQDDDVPTVHLEGRGS